MKRRPVGLRGKVLLVLAAVALVPAMILGALGITAVRGLSATARTQARAALEEQLRQRLISRVQEKARADDALFQGVLSQAVSLSRYVAWYYDNPGNLPEPGYLRGGSELLETPQGHKVNLPDTAVGVFVSRRTDMNDAVWREVGTLSFADPLLVSVGSSTPAAKRVWVISASGIVRIFPNVQLGHEGSPVGPDHDSTVDEPFQAAGPQRNPGHQPLWSAPYTDAVSGQRMITAVAPVYGADGRFRAVAGVDMALSQVLDGVLQSESDPDGYAFLLNREGKVVSAPTRAWSDLSLPAASAQEPGRAVVTPLAASALPAVAGLAHQLTGTAEPGLTDFDGPAGRNHVAYAPLNSTGWVLAMVAPADKVGEPVAGVQRSIRRLESVFSVGGALAVLLTIGLVAFLSSRASALLTRPVARLVQGTHQLAADLSHRLPEGEPDEFGALAGAFNTMAASLEHSRAEAVRQARLVVEERNRLAREIHDTIAQGLAGIVVHLETVEDCLGPQPDPDAARSLCRARDLARSSLQEARRSVWNLRPSAVAGYGLTAALRQLAAAMEQDGIPCVVEAGDELTVLPGAEDALFRVCQEALTNVRRHSGATVVTIRLAAPGGEAVLQISDNGRGFDPALAQGPRPGGGFGLWAMRERMEQAGGTLTVQSEPGGGTTVTARAPLTGGR